MNTKFYWCLSQQRQQRPQFPLPRRPEKSASPEGGCSRGQCSQYPASSSRGSLSLTNANLQSPHIRIPTCLQWSCKDLISFACFSQYWYPTVSRDNLHWTHVSVTYVRFATADAFTSAIRFPTNSGFWGHEQHFTQCARDPPSVFRSVFRWCKHQYPQMLSIAMMVRHWGQRDGRAIVSKV